MINDYVLLKDLEINTKIGILPHERLKKQPVVLTLKLHVDVHSAASEDDIAAAVNYSDIVSQLKNYVESLDCHLIETLAEKIANWVLGNHRIHKVAVELIKPEAMAGKTQVGVFIERTL